MGYPVAQANTQEPLRFLMVLTSDHITGATGKVCTVTIAKNGGVAFVPPVGSISELGNGWYSVAAHPADASSLGPLLLHATAAGCDPTDDVFDIVSYNPTSFSPITAPTGPGAIAAQEIINDAFSLIGMYEGTLLDPALYQGALRRLNQVMAQWQLMPLTATATVRETFPLILGKGTPANPYTVGIGGDLNTSRPTDLDAVAIWVLANPPFELARTIYTDAAYQAISTKTLLSTYFSGVYYSPTYASGLGSLYLYPIPTQQNEIVLYRKQDVAGFVNLTTPYDLPPGAPEAITYELAHRLARPYGRDWSPDLAKDAADFLAVFKRANTRMADLALDPALVSDEATVWDILSDP